MRPTHPRQEYNDLFLNELERLNAGQREAVDHIEGPVLVIAGPGTGKTHILTARIGRILMETDTQPQNILCLTFTDAGVRAMRERLLTFIGPEAHRVHIFTFHSFCNSVIQENLELFGRHDLEPLSDLERIGIVRGILDRLDLDHPLIRGRADAYFYEEHLYDLFQRMKSEGWTEGEINRRIDSFVEDLPNRKEFVYQTSRGHFKKGDLKKAKIEETLLKMDRLRAAVALFPDYEKALREARRYDYDDMILWVLNAFRENEALLSSYQERYLYFLVDEYQDTNGAQNEIIKQLIAYWENPNIFIVGDDDQSIFEFQGARLKNLTDFYHSFKKDLRLVLLRDNYRSAQTILDVSQALIRHNAIRIVNSLSELGIEKVLTARNGQVAALPQLPTITEYPNRFQEEVDVVQQILDLQQQGVPLNDIAVIYAKHRQAENLIALLEKKEIPYQTRRKINILHLPLIRQLIDLLEYLQAEFRRPMSGEHLLFRLLHFPFLKIAPSDLAGLSVHMARQQGENRPYWRYILSDTHLPAAIHLQHPEAFERAGAWIELLLGEWMQLSLPALLERLINRTGLLQFVLEQPDKIGSLQALNTFMEFARQETYRYPKLSVSGLLDILHRMEANRLPLELVKHIAAEEGVHLVTAHSAKGLEFGYVFLIDCVKEQWESRGRGSSYRFALPDTLTFSGEEDALEARRRLFYVALTRARKGVFLSYSRTDPAGKELQQAIFIDELTNGTGIEVGRKETPAAALLETQALRLLEKHKPVVPTLDRFIVEQLLEGFTLSVTALNGFLKCPLIFYYEQVLRVPVQISEAASYGMAMHKALQRLFEKMLLSEEKQFLPEEAFIQLFDYEMEKLRGQFSMREFQRRLETGRRHLSGFYQSRMRNWQKKVKVEWTVRQVEVDGVPLTGTIDKVEWLDPLRVKIVDYKTGSPYEAKVRPPSAAQPTGGSYWRQLVFYKILFERYHAASQRVVSGTIDYLEPDTRGQFIHRTLDFQPEWDDLVRSFIRKTYERIRNHDFYEGCGASECRWCNFTRQHQLTDSFSEPDLEELDD